MTENLPATITEEYGTGLEDLDPNEVQIPRVKINHKDATFVDGLTGEEFAEMHGVFLGMVKQRIKWYPDMDGNDPMPQCKSNDGAVGYPNIEGPSEDDKFPWNDSGLDPNAMPRDTQGRITIACAACPFAQWTGTKAKPKPPLCNEMHVYPMMYSTEAGQPMDRAGIVTFKGSGIKPSKAFLLAFSRLKKPVYSAYAAVSLDKNKRGSVEYSTPKFKKTGDVPVEEWADFAKEYGGLREFLRQPPRQSEEVHPGSAGSMPLPQQSPAAPHIPTQRTAPPSTPPAPSPQATAPSSIIDSVATSVHQPLVDDDDELPF